MKLFHTIVVVGAAMTGPATVTALTLLPGCNMEAVGFPTIDMSGFFTIAAPDMAHFNIIDAGNRD